MFHFLANSNNPNVYLLICSLQFEISTISRKKSGRIVEDQNLSVKLNVFFKIELSENIHHSCNFFPQNNKEWDSVCR